MAVDDTGSSTPSTRGTSGSGTTSKPASLPRRRSSATLPRRWWPKWKSSPTTTARAPRQPTSTSCTKSSADSCGPLLVEVDDGRDVHAGGRQQLQLLVEIGEQQRRRLGPHDHGGMAVERDHCGPRAQVGGQPPDVGDDRPVAEVDTVVGADGDDAALRRALTALEIGHHLHALHASGAGRSRPALGGEALVSRGRAAVTSKM